MFNHTNSSGEWVQIGQNIDTERAIDFSCESVNLSSDGRTIAIGAYYNDGNSHASGHVHVYSFNDTGDSTGKWTQVGPDIDGERAGDTSDWSVSLSNNGMIVAIGWSSW